jgi:hypothetical protein
MPFCGTLRAADALPPDWTYAAYFGTGWYRLGDVTDVFAISYTPTWQLRDAQLTADGRRRIGIELKFPVTAAVQNFDLSDLESVIDVDNLSSLSLVPGVELEIPMGPRWSLKPLAHLGYGSELRGDTAALIYWSGLRSRLRFDAGSVHWALINSLVYVGYTDRDRGSGRVIPLTTAAEIEQPLKKKRIGGDPVVLTWHAGYTTNLQSLAVDLGIPGAKAVDIDDEWELGVAFRKDAKRLKLWRLSWERVGIAFRVGSGGDFAGIGLYFRSLFDR